MSETQTVGNRTMNNIKLLRQRAQLTQRELAEKTGLTQSKLSMYESGGYNVDGMRYKTAAALAAALGCTMEQLAAPITDKEPEEEPDNFM